MGDDEFQSIGDKIKCLNNYILRKCVWFFALCLPCISSPAATNFPGGEASQTFDTTAHPKAKGLGLKIDVPVSWKIEEGKRPNTIGLATSHNGLGLESCALVINSLQQLGWSQATARSETSESLSIKRRLAEAARSMGGRLIDGGGADLEGLPSRWLLVASNYARDGSSFSYYTANWQILYRQWVINLTCGTGDKSASEAESRLRHFLPTFRLIANSLLIPSRWE
mgnify:CR=1 FL=1